ncbi:MAG: TIGR00341 family protein [Bacteroidales bacterium]|nr:TIGR00341 family protein [Bacteroidales bacterium]
MTNSFSKNRILVILRKYFSLRNDKDDEQTVITEIKQGVSFRGANLWVLILAIFVASLGLNVNSTAVIIGAMLISPLMGPIIGMGLAVGITDIELLKRSFKNFLIATGISILTATVYWFISPFDEPQSELIARTTPNLYDVLIAFCGGAAGIVATCTKGKGNVIPGVAIATALMPPLCTAGYGLATAQWQFFFGAFYLYFINSVFICVATLLGVRLMKFKQLIDVNKQQFSKIRNKFLLVIALTLIPALIMTINIVQDSLLKSNVNRFLHDTFNSPSNKIISNEINKNSRTIKIVSIGKEITQDEISSARNAMKNYKLGKYSLEIIQGTQPDSLLSLHGDVEQLVNRQNEYEKELEKYRQTEKLSAQANDEARILFPYINELTLTLSTKTAEGSKTKNDVIIAVAETDINHNITQTEKEKILQWLKTRTKTNDIILYTAQPTQ